MRSKWYKRWLRFLKLKDRSLDKICPYVKIEPTLDEEILWSMKNLNLIPPIPEGQTLDESITKGQCYIYNRLQRWRDRAVDITASFMGPTSDGSSLRWLRVDSIQRDLVAYEDPSQSRAAKSKTCCIQ
mmetsp:Transcript_18575/g.46812  ORF Transcript_18575/g.46812 Transcript_18575/m.46812 type:complete len:128 (+) Transcript_18575:67-450(+)